MIFKLPGRYAWVGLVCPSCGDRGGQTFPLSPKVRNMTKAQVQEVLDHCEKKHTAGAAEFTIPAFLWPFIKMILQAVLAALPA